MHLNENTTVPLWAALGSIPVFITLVSWLTFQSYSLEAYGQRLDYEKVENKEKFSELFSDLKEMRAQNMKILEKVIRIEEQTKK